MKCENCGMDFHAGRECPYCGHMHANSASARVTLDKRSEKSTKIDLDKPSGKSTKIDLGKPSEKSSRINLDKPGSNSYSDSIDTNSYKAPSEPIDLSDIGGTSNNYGDLSGSNLNYNTNNYNTNNYNSNNSSNNPILPMKWYTFQKVMLFISAIFNLINAVSYVFDFNDMEYIYDYIPGLQVIDVIYGIVLLIMGICMFKVWKALQDYKTGAGDALNKIYIASMVIAIVYNVLYSGCISSVGLSTDPTTYVTLVLTVIINIIVIKANKTYFDNRRHIFKN